MAVVAGQLLAGVDLPDADAVVVPQPVDTSRLPSGVKATQSQPCVEAVIRFSSLPVAASHTRSVLSKLLVATRLPSFDQDTAVMAPVWPEPDADSLPVAKSQIRSVPGAVAKSVPRKWPTATFLPSGEKARQRG